MNQKKLIFWFGVVCTVLIGAFTGVMLFLLHKNEKDKNRDRTQKARENSIINAEQRRQEKERKEKQQENPFIVSSKADPVIKPTEQNEKAS